MKNFALKHSKKIVSAVVVCLLVAFTNVPVAVATAVGDAIGGAVQQSAEVE